MLIAPQNELKKFSEAGADHRQRHVIERPAVAFILQYPTSAAVQAVDDRPQVMCDTRDSGFTTMYLNVPMIVDVPMTTLESSYAQRSLTRVSRTQHQVLVLFCLARAAPNDIAMRTLGERPKPHRFIQQTTNRNNNKNNDK